MDMVKSMLREERAHASEVRDHYAAELEKLPRGALVRKRIHGREYLYMMRREGRKVKTDYVGPVSDERAARIAGDIEKRRHYEQMLRDVEKKIRYLEKVINVNTV